MCEGGEVAEAGQLLQPAVAQLQPRQVGQLAQHAGLQTQLQQVKVSIYIYIQSKKRADKDMEV